MKVAVLGGTGAFGSALARAARGGRDGRDDRLARRRPRSSDGCRDRSSARAANADAVGGVDLVVLAVDASAALSTTAELADAIGETPVLSVASQIRFENRRARSRATTACRSPNGCRSSSTARSSRASTRSRRASLAAGKAEGDALVCGDDETAKAAALELAATLVTGRALDAGPLASARALEGMTAVIVNLNRRYRGHAGLQIVGL